MTKRLWPILAVAGGLVMTAWARTVDTSFDRGPLTERNVAEIQSRRTHEAMIRAERAYRQYVRADSLLPLLPSEPALRVALSPLLPPMHAAVLDSAIAAEVSDIDAMRARVGVFLVDTKLGSRARRWTSGRDEREIHTGVDSAGAYCAIVSAMSVTDDGRLDGSGFGLLSTRGRRQNTIATVLGPCAFYARYGAPGPQIGRWLEQGGYRFADVSGEHVREWGTRRDPQLWIWSENDLWLRGCRAGRDELCRETLMWDARDHDGPASFDLTTIEWLQAVDARRMLDGVEREFGAERFAQFWTSDQDVETAFASAFGVSANEWLAKWSAETWGATHLAASVATPDLLLSLLVIAVLAGISALVASRRTI